MALLSWMNHEEARVEEVKRVIEKEEKEPLYIRTQLVSPMDVIRNHGIISDDVVLTSKYLANCRVVTRVFFTSSFLTL